MIERLAYLIKTYLTGIFPVIAYAGRLVTALRFSRQRAEALAEASIQGEVAGQRAVMRPLGLCDLDALQGFIKAMPESHLAYFHPHGFSRPDLTAVLGSRNCYVPDDSISPRSYLCIPVKGDPGSR